MSIFPIGMMVIGLLYTGWAVASLSTGRIRTLPKTFVEKRQFPVTYWLLFWWYMIFGLGIGLTGMAITVKLVVGFFKPT